MDIDATKQQLRKGLLVYALLTVIAADELYVADILKTLNASEFATQEGTLYPLLSKLKREALISYRWVESPSGPPRKYYALTDTGKKYLHDLDAYWNDINTAIAKLKKGEKA
jgi:PadR family transcriptional regulator PadR